MEYHLLRETTDNAETFIPTGELLRGSLEDAAAEAVRRSQAGVRTAIYIYENVNLRPAETTP